jgi:hypothetical protein
MVGGSLRKEGENRMRWGWMNERMKGVGWRQSGERIREKKLKWDLKH